ncbi:hypothetical protein BAUCODRAFT_124554 [Baudoinia panamericana UAMH 10762]|uniref:54S ribosomal protein L31, mitochondrial n=1 Tax=Baudoinia panamericana (strain UAMH 10762) TaxID=717646 RepID=M2MQN0_BAUPA|nr:uncharacterized protein BAUCODRAFT_124554 [Baudoinia panamericana UAMH 10762]EMC93798.1 hypothetical protein BAUCODRAFT_124554 [Baudoinia panamericana UAMH 10762]
MFGAFKPSSSLSGGLLWKIPWRLSPPQKLRHRRRMRRVDNVVATLDTALKRQDASTSARSQHANSATSSDPPPSQIPTNSTSHSAATPTDLSSTAEGRRLLDASTHSTQDSLRHGRGPRQGELVPGSTRTRLGDQARRESTIKLIERWKAEMPTEQEMLPRDKYTMFDRKVKGYRKGVHKLPKWTRVSQRLNPPGF